MGDQTKTANRLINETSPYLLQHAYNPVDWYPWGEEAFEQARREDKPVFLSIGYSSCHWCHVMEREVFEKDRAAEILNGRFVSVKLDREERPDVDHLYMEACVALTGSGGWPLSLFLTPDKKPFLARTYLPLESFVRTAAAIHQLWQTDRQQVTRASGEVLEALGRSETRGQWDTGILHRAFGALERSYDPVLGGFGGAPKFPSPHTLMYLQRYTLRFQNQKAEEMARHTLEKMALGGLFDQVGGGFFRYSTDADYRIPHFEKMLYDNAMLALVCCEFGYTDITRRVLDFCLRELYAQKEGAFYTALDADSEGEEGKYYLFTPGELAEILGPDGEAYSRLFDVTEKGNYEGKSHLNLLKTGPLGQEESDFARSCHQRVLAWRQRRVPPFRDEKILLSSNGLMLAALATVARLEQDEEARQLAVRLAEFLTGAMRQNGRYYASCIDGRLAPHPATSDGYAYLAWGLMALHQATLDDIWLDRCKEVCDGLLALFQDEDGLLRMAGRDVEDLPLATRDVHDGALPSGSAVASEVLQRLALLTGQEQYTRAHEKIRESLGGRAAGQPTAYTAFLSAMFMEESALKVELPEEMIHVSKRFFPFTTFSRREGEEALICDTGSCRPPVADARELEEIIRGDPGRRERGRGGAEHA